MHLKVDFNELKNIASQRCYFKKEELQKLYWKFHPRFRYFKSCVKQSNFFDVGAGNGGLSFWKEWDKPSRVDIKMYAVDLQKGEFSNNYERFDVFNLDEDDFPYEKEFFDNIYFTHVLEHLRKPETLIKNVYRTLKTGGMIYIETPNQNSMELPGMEMFKENGFITSTMNFYDDKTHIKTYCSDEIKKLFEQFRDIHVIEKGTIQNEYMDDVLIAYGYQFENQELMTYGLWLKYKWSDYLILRKQ